MVDQTLPELFDAIVVDVAGSFYALLVTDVRSVTYFRDAYQVLEVPLAPPSLRGVALIEGEPALVIDLVELLSSPQEETCGRGFSSPLSGVLCKRDGEVALLIGGQVKSVGKLRSAESNGVSSSSLTTQSIEWRGRVVPVLSLPHVIASVSVPRERGRPYE